MDEEGLGATKNDRIFIGKPIEMDYVEFEEGLWELDEAVWRETGDIRSMVKKLVPGYHYTESERLYGDRKDTGEAFYAAKEAAASMEWIGHHRKLAEQEH